MVIWGEGGNIAKYHNRFMSAKKYLFNIAYSFVIMQCTELVGWLRAALKRFLFFLGNMTEKEVEVGPLQGRDETVVVAWVVTAFGEERGGGGGQRRSQAQFPR